MKTFSFFSPQKRRFKDLYSRSKQGFTLIEIIVVIAMIGVVAGGLVVLINPLGQIQKARDSSRKNDLEQIRRALEQYYNDYGVYPSSSNGYIIIDSDGTTERAWGAPWSPYIDTLPKDSLSTYKYVYYSPPTNSSVYRLYTHLEKIGDPQLCVVAGTDCPNVPAANLCGDGGNVASCNYGVSSPNVSP